MVLSVATLLRRWKTWFIDDKFLKFYSWSHKKYAQSNRIYVSVGIVGLSHVQARQCTKTLSMREGFGSRDAWFHVPMLLSADTMNIFHQRTRLSSPSKQGSNWQHQLRLASLYTCDTLWRQRYVTTSKKYLINCHILLKYFELLFLQLQLVKISCEFVIIWVNYERKKGCFYETPCTIYLP